ncbi:MAG: hypothetical protein ACJ79R_23395, partial [Anaeromyxobacteraceae bacterium]
LMRCSGLLAIALGALLAPLAARATLVRPTTVEAMARRSDAVVRGVIVSRRSISGSGAKRIVTLVDVETRAVWRGEAPPLVVVVVPGGTVDGLAQHVAGAPEFTIGEEVALFLRREGRGRFRVKNLALGKFAIRGGQAAPRLDGVGFVAGEVTAGERRVEAMSAAELERRVRSAR